jgi:hypothetical protein
MYNKHMGERINTHVVVRGRPEGKRLLGRTRHRWKNNIETDLKHNARMQNRLNWLRIGMM